MKGFEDLKGIKTLSQAYSCDVMRICVLLSPSFKTKEMRGINLFVREKVNIMGSLWNAFLYFIMGIFTIGSSLLHINVTQ